MVKAIINVIKGFIKLPFLVLSICLICFPMLFLMLLSEVEDYGSGKGWGNDGFFFKLQSKLVNNYLKLLACLRKK